MSLSYGVPSFVPHIGLIPRNLINYFHCLSITIYLSIYLFLSLNQIRNESIFAGMDGTQPVDNRIKLKKRIRKTKPYICICICINWNLCFNFIIINITIRELTYMNLPMILKSFGSLNYDKTICVFVFLLFARFFFFLFLYFILYIG